MNAESGHRHARNVWAFFVLTFLYSWLVWLPSMLSGFGVIASLPSTWTMPAVLLGAFGPLLAAVTLVVRQGGWKAARSYLGQCLDLRVKAKPFLWALLLPLLVTVVAHYLAIFTGLDKLPASFLPDNLPVPAVVLAIPYFLAMLLAGGGQEEFGWRGYAQEPLQERFGIFWGSALLGVVWGFWHLPLWIMPGDGHANYPFPAFLVCTVGLALILGYLYNLSGKKLVAPWVAHAMSNTAIPLFPVLHMEKVAQPGYWLWVGLMLLSGLGLAWWYQSTHGSGQATEANVERPAI